MFYNDVIVLMKKKQILFIIWLKFSLVQVNLCDVEERRLVDHP